MIAQLEPTTAESALVAPIPIRPLSSDTALQAIVERLYGRTDDIAHDMVARYRQEIPEYAALDHDLLLGDVFAVSATNVRMLLGNLAQPRPLSIYEVTKISIAALRRARQGVPLEAMLHAYRLWARVLWSAVATNVDPGARAEVEAALTIGARILEHADHVATAVTGAYRDESAGVSQTRGLLARDTLECLILGGGDSLQVRGELAMRRVTVFDGNVVVILRAFAAATAGVAAVPEPLSASVVRRHVDILQTELSSDVGDLIVGVRDQEIVVVYPMRDPNGLSRLKDQCTRLAEALSDDVVAVGLGEWHADASEIPQSYVEARQATDVAIAGNVRGRYVAFSDVMINDLLHADQASALVIAAVLTPVEKYDAANNSSLMSTLGAYFEAGFNLTGAAATLFVRPNTVMYRLKRVGELTGRNPFDPNDLLLLVLAWKLRSVGARDRAMAA